VKPGGIELAKFKGSVFESTRRFTEKEFGEGASTRVLEELSPADREILRGVQVLDWVQVEPVLQYHYALDRLFGTGDLSVCTAAGRFSAGWAINTVLKVFVRFQSPHWLVEKSTSVWGRYHDTGHWEVDKQGPLRLSGRLSAFAVRDPAFCARLHGWLHGAVELTGGRHPVVTESRCAAHGHRECTFTITWQE
jgi:hypothetical protein